MKEFNLLKIAKNSEKDKPSKKKDTNEIITTIKNESNSNEERDLMAKQKAEELLSGIDITLRKKDDDLILIDEDKKIKSDGLEYLSDEVARLTSELDLMRESYDNLLVEYENLKNNNDDNQIKNTVITLFNEIQSHYNEMGKNQLGQPNLVLPPAAFMNRMIMFFPFLSEVKHFE